MKLQYSTLVSLLFVFLLSACGGGGGAGSPSVASIGITPSTASISVGATQQYTATASDSSGGVITGTSFDWTSSDSSIATVDSTGLVTAVAAGTATITASDGSISGSASITVTGAVATVSLSPATATIVAGATRQLTATAKDSAGTTVAGATFSYSSSDTSIATVDANGLVTAVASGNATITATSGSVNGTAAITVTPVPTTVSVSPSGAVMAPGATQQLTATAKDSGGTAINGATFSYTSSNTSAATVDANGLVTAVADGTATITATSSGVSGTSSITVTSTPSTVTVSPSSATIVPTGTQQLTATAKDGSGTTIVGASFTYTSSDTNVATVDANGLVTGVATGSVTITATSGGTSGTASITVASATAVTGTAATGSPITGATITLVDSTGQSATATTAADGTFSLDSTGMTPPFMVKITVAATNTTLYSVSADSNADTVINVDPLTDLVIRSWYSIQGQNIDTAFANPAGAAPPSPAQVNIISSVVVKVVQLWLSNAGVDVSSFNIISTPFAADGTGVDKVLDMTTVDSSSGAITVDDGTTTQNTTLTYDTSTGSVSVDTTTTNSSGTTSSSSTTTVPVSDAEVTAIDTIESELDAFANLINTKGSALTTTDIMPYISSTLLDQGLNADQFAAQTVTHLRGATLSLNLLNIDSIDTTNGKAHVTFNAAITASGVTQTDIVDFYFVESAGQWLMDGDQRIAAIELDAEMRNSQGAYVDQGPDINVDVSAPQGTITGATVQGDTVFSTATALTSGGTRVETFEPTSGTTQTLTLDAFYLNTGNLTSLVPVGTPFTVAVTPASGSNVSYTYPLNAFTTEPVSITSPTGTTLADANLDSALTVNWTLPTTFAIAKVQLEAWVFVGPQGQSGTVSCDVTGPVLATSATTGSITIPSTCQGSAITSANLNLNITGVNGERTIVIYEFN